MFKLVVTTCAGIILIFPFTSMAQTIPTAPFFIKINPLYPVPNSNATVSITSGSVDVISGIFDISINGKRIATKTGAQSVSFNTGAVGKSMQITVTLKVNGVSYEKTLTLIPEGVALAVEPLTTTHSFYLGAPTIASGGDVRLVAIPSFRTMKGALIKADALSYIWKIGNRTLTSQSGIGRTAIIVPAPLPYNDSIITVLVQNKNKSLVALKNVTISPTKPVVLIYKKDPLMGIEYDHALSGNQPISGAETSFVAVPYGFSIYNGGPSISWTLNDTVAHTGDTITLQSKGQGTGSSQLSASASNRSTYESATSALTVLFGTRNNSGFGLFGL